MRYGAAMDKISIPERMDPLSRIEGTTPRDRGEPGKQKHRKARRVADDSEPLTAEETEQHGLDELA
jgi:hypothetical protein